MNFDMDAFEKMLDADLANPNGYWNSLKRKKEHKEKRFDKFEKWLETNDFNLLLQKLFERNGYERREWCYKKGWMPYPTPLLQFVFDYITERVDEMYNDKIQNTPFDNGIWYFKGYWFKMICGQGECPIQVFDENSVYVFSL